MVLLNEPLTWLQIYNLVSSYDLEKLGRSKSQTEAYKTFKTNMRNNNVDITTNLLIETLHWLPKDTLPSTSSEKAMQQVKYNNPIPFADPDDVYITINRFPYYIKEHTLHLLIWVKFPMNPDPESPIGDISSEMKKTIELYIQKTFVEFLGIRRDHIIWWKNYAALQSVKSLPHIHCLINLDDDQDGKLENKIHTIVGKSGIMINSLEPKTKL